ncbi:DUF2281 domain-containing protein [Leptolyngbya sp. NK1-12]|uniref:DUF2281 domain-containing protein n=1 Tax=Leptolyngbya sp. NK1-12 TaxID=2547451 RepID=A0AA96WIF6_9CYAN|nr:DUF2281 domain-containing protein [Leptolyngbya sp. NK1-12]WNZ21941.1 DUF2281 domain-containing protein [Leptolyngbya sp. NK1-12]
MTLEQAILEKVRSLSPDKQQEILDFAEFLLQKSRTASPQKLSIQPKQSLAEFYGCIQDETFIRQPQGTQPDRELLA